MLYLYFDQEDEDLRGTGWNLVDDEGRFAARYETEDECWTAAQTQAVRLGTSIVEGRVGEA